MTTKQLKDALVVAENELFEIKKELQYHKEANADLSCEIARLVNEIGILEIENKMLSEEIKYAEEYSLNWESLWRNEKTKSWWQKLWE